MILPDIKYKGTFDRTLTRFFSLFNIETKTTGTPTILKKTKFPTEERKLRLTTDTSASFPNVQTTIIPFKTTRHFPSFGRSRERKSSRL